MIVSEESWLSIFEQQVPNAIWRVDTEEGSAQLQITGAGGDDCGFGHAEMQGRQIASHFLASAMNA